MNTYIVKENQIDEYYNCIINGVNSLIEAKMKIDLMGLESMDLDEAKKRSEVGDCIILEYDGKMLPFQVVHKYKNGDCVMTSYYVVENHIFDEKTNVWKDSEIRKYMNEDMAKKFNPELLKRVKSREVHTDNYVTNDKFWLLSHEEIGYKDSNNMFKKNVGTETFDYYKDIKDTEQI